ncbi:uncharacterized protein [Primulina eburnea]|uniref:uncharacterized protein n=1 Tax=Primulina eburnea TaxID=1245227 RepID=UPI003C6CB02F
MIIMQFLAQRVFIPKVVSTVLFHGHSSIEPSYAAASTIWFTKVVCTILVNHSQSLSVFDCDYFRKNLNPLIALGVIHHLSYGLKDPGSAFRFFQYLRINLNIIHSESSFDLLLRSLCHMGLHDSAKLVYGYMKTDGFFPQNSTLDFLVSSFTNAGRFKIAEEILIAKAESCSEKGEIVSSFVYNNFLSLLVGKNRLDEAVSFFKGHILRLQSFCPDTCSFNIVMRGLCRVGKVEDAFEFFSAMESFGCLPDLITYNTLVNGLCRVGNVDRAQLLLREVELHREFSPDVVTYTSVISGYCKSGSMEKAVTLFDEMIQRGTRPNLFTFNIIIDGFSKKGDSDSALMMYERMLNGGLKPDVVTFTSIIDSHCRTGDLDKSMKLWDEMNKRQVSPNAYTFSIQINALCKANRLNESRDLLRQMNFRKDIIPSPFIYNPVIDGFCKAGNLDEANAIVAEMEAKGCVHDKMTFTILILGHCMKGRTFEAIDIYKKMLSVGCAPDNITMSSLTSCLRKAGMASEANEIELSASNNANTGLSSLEKTTHLMSNMNIPVAV